MKKTPFILWFLALACLWLTACDNSKDYNMSFDEAYTAANRSVLQDIITKTENFQQSFDVSTNLDNNWTKVTAKIQADSKQNLDNSKSESTTLFDVNINSDGSNLVITWALDLKLVDNTIYLNLKSLGLSWPEDVSFLTAMIEWFKNQRYLISMEWLSDVPSTLSYIKDAKQLNEQAKGVIINEWSEIYNWKFAEFNWYNSYKFSLDTEKLQQLINDYYDKVNESLDNENKQEAPQLNIQNFEWYLVITWKDRVTTVIENMDMLEWETNININGFWGENYEINALSNWDSLLKISAIKRGSSYNISLVAANEIKLEWTITPKVSSSKINVNFDVTLAIKAENGEEQDIIVPLEGNRRYNQISEFDVIAPEWAQDLSELLWSYLWALWWDSYSDELSYKDNWEYEDVYVGDLEELWNWTIIN